MSSKYMYCIIKLMQSHMEFHVQKKLIKENNLNLVTVGFAFIGKMIEAGEFLYKTVLINIIPHVTSYFKARTTLLVRSSSATEKLYDAL